MGKFRSKLKRHTKGKSWGHGQSATSNPENKKHRNKARSRFFQPNLSLAPTDSALTAEAVYKHDVRQSFAGDGKPGAGATTVNDIAGSLRSFALNGDEEMGQSELGTFQTHKTFASSYSACTNMSFNKLLNGFRSDSPLHKEMLAILAALTATITERGGTGTSTEYFLALMESFDAITERGDQETIACVNLLSMGIKSVPTAILRARFAETAVRLEDIMLRYMSDAEHLNTLRSVLSSLSALLRAQPHAEWQTGALASAQTYFNKMLSFATHSKPKIRKSAQQAVTSVIHGSCFMLPTPAPVDEAEADAVAEPAEPIPSSITHHPAGSLVAKFCLDQCTPDNIANAHTTILHTLGLLRDTMHGFRTADIQLVCERLLSIMTAANVLIRTNCFHVLHSLFAARSRNLTAELTGRLITALYEYRPEKSDARQTLAWLTVLKEAHVALSAYDLPMTVRAVPALIEVCAGDLWLSERNEVVSGASNALRELFLECVRPACGTKLLAEQHREPIVRCIAAVAGALTAPFGHVATQVVLTFATVFEVCGKWFGPQLIEPLRTIGGRYDAESAFRLQIEHTVLAAIASMGAECALRAIPLTKRAGAAPGTAAGELELSRSWMLPLLREAVAESTLEYFAANVLPLADGCHGLWKRFQAAGDAPMAHTYELLWNQLWGLLPGFCRRPLDMENFRLVAQKMGVQLRDNAELRAPVLDGLKELMAGAEEEGKQRIGLYAKNFLPLLFNIYIRKPQGSYEAEIRASTLLVIGEMLRITPRATLDETYANVQERQQKADAGSFESEALYDIVEQLAVYQSAEQLKQLLVEFVAPVLRRQKKAAAVAKGVEKIKKQQRKAYLLLQNVLSSELEECQRFVAGNLEEIQELVLSALKTTCNTTQAARLNCIKLLIEKQDHITLDNALIIRTIPEIIVAFNHGANKRDNVAINLIIKIGEICRADEKLNDFIDTILVGFGGDTVLITNTILTLKAVISHFSANLTVNTLKFILEQVLVFVVGKSRNEVEASIAFLITFIKALPAPFVALQLESIVRAISAMVPDTKRYCRIHVGFVLRKLCKRFTAEEIVKCVPGNDEITHKKLKNIRKELNRTKRQKAAKQGAAGDEGDSDEEDETGGLEKKSYTIADILADSDSDFDEMDDDEDGKRSKPTKKTKNAASFIQEDAENIVDLADVNAIGRITSSKPLPKTGNALIDADNSAAKKTKDSNRGFQLADDGRLIIAEPTRRGRGARAAANDSGDSDDDFDVEGAEAAGVTAAGNKKRSLADDSDDSDDDDEEEAGAPSRKRAHMDGAQSMRSGRTGASSAYVAGGRGIHRPNAAASVRSGVSRMSGKSGASAAASVAGTSKSFGGAYKAKKAGGDVKKGKLDPYAYIPLSRTSMNKRKRAKSAGQFDNVVAGARKGAAAGSKGRILKAVNKRK